MTPEQAQLKKKKKKDKVRSAWISFAGRIVAQLMGAVATVALGVMVVQRYQSGSSGPVPPIQSSQQRPAPARLATPGEVSLAVLALDNFSADEHAHFAEGMTEALVADLSRVRGLRVISRTSSTQFRGQRKPLPEIARELGVDLVVEGSITQADGRVRITAQLIDGKTDEHLWAHTYDRPLRDVLALQAEVATAIARAVHGAIASSESARPSPGDGLQE